MEDHLTYKPSPTRIKGATLYEVVSDTESLSLMEQVLEEIRGLRMDLMQQDGVSIVDGCGSMRRATVSSTGALSVAPANYDETASQTMSSTATAFNFFEPNPSQQFVITGLLAFATKDVSDASDTIITVYEADQSTEITSTKDLMVFGMGKLTNLQLVPLNLLVNAGVYVNGKTDDATINMTLMGYFVNLTPEGEL